MKIILGLTVTLILFLLTFIICAIKIGKEADERVLK